MWISQISMVGMKHIIMGFKVKLLKFFHSNAFNIIIIFHHDSHLVDLLNGQLDGHLGSH